jgi:hypothetical protein
MAESNKFISFNREEFEKCMNALRLEVDASIVSDIMGRELDDAVVIRKRDSLAAPVLHTYASLAQTSIDILHEVGVEAPESLSQIRDHFWNEASEAEAYPVKRLPSL